MRSWILPIVGLALIAGLAYAVRVQATEIQRLTGLIEGKPSSTAKTPAGTGDAPGEGMAARIEQLENEVTSLRSRLGRAEITLRWLDDGDLETGATGGNGRGKAAGVSGANEDDVEGAVLGLLDSQDGEVREKLRKVIEEEREAVREQHQKEREQRWQQRTEGLLDQLADEAGLGEEARQGIVDLLQQERERMREIFQQARSGGSPAEAHEKAQQARQQTDERVKEMVDAQQYDAYRKMRESQMSRRFGGPPGPPPGDRGGPPQ
jgi:hypothetical protein